MRPHPDEYADQRRPQPRSPHDMQPGLPIVVALVAACALVVLVAITGWSISSFWPDQTPNGCVGLLGEKTACAEGL